MKLTYNKCWDGGKHQWDASHGGSSSWQVWCNKCGCMSLFRRQYIIAGKWEVVKNSEGNPIFKVPEYLEQAAH